MKKEYIYVSTTIILWSLSAAISKLFFEGLDTYFILFTTSLFSWGLLFAGTLYNQQLEELKHTSLKTIALMVGVGSLGIFFCNYFYQRGIALLPAQTAFVINYLWPTFIIIFSKPILHERITLVKMIAILMSFSGVIVSATNGDLSVLIGGSMKGIILSIFSALFYGLYSPLNKKYDYNKDLALMLTYAFSTVLSFILTFTTKGFVIPTLSQFIGMMLFGAFINGIGYLTWNKAMEYGNTAIISNLAYLTPVLSLFATHYLLGEIITIYSVIGLALILGGVGIQLLGKEK